MKMIDNEEKLKTIGNKDDRQQNMTENKDDR